MSVWSAKNRVLRTCFHQGWTEAITWQSKSSQRVWSAWEQRGSTKFPGNSRSPGPLHPELCTIAAPLYQLTRKETGKFHWGKQEEEAFRKIQDTISSEKTMAFFEPSKPIILCTEASFNEGLAPEDRQRRTTGTLHQPNNDRNWEQVQSNRESCFGNQMGQGESENLPTWRTQIYNRDCPQTTSTFV